MTIEHDLDDDLDAIRHRIDAIDSQLLGLLHERLACAREIGRLKAQDNRASWDPRREQQIHERLAAQNRGVFPEDALHSIVHEIITTCRLAQRPTTVAYLGPEGTFTQEAAELHFGRQALFLPRESAEDIFEDVARGRSEYGVVPVENSIEGSVTSTLDGFIRCRVQIVAELYLPIRHHLLCRSGDREAIRTVTSHPQALAQCRGWLQKNLPGIPCQPVLSTALAAQLAAQDGSVAAIASHEAMKRYRLQVVAPRIEDRAGNTTRFLVIGRQSPMRTGRDKTSVLIGLMDRPGALQATLSLLADRHINLTRIESRPNRDQPWSYLFFLDLEGHYDDDVVQDGCQRLREACTAFVWLGSYPKADRRDEPAAGC
ncbi:MAG: prephenate dehydratase [Thermodesulfobacteriota bacterium]